MFLDIGLDKVDPYRLPAKGWLPAVPKTGGDRFDLELESVRRTAQFYSEESSMYEAYEKESEKLYMATGRRMPNPWGAPKEAVEPSMFSVSSESREKRIADYKQAVQEARAQGVAIELRDPDEIKADVEFRAKKAWDEAFQAGQVSSPWSGFGAFAGAAAGFMSDPVQAASLPFGASARLSGSLAARTLKAMAAEGGVAAGVQLGVEVGTVDFKKRAQIPDNPFANVLAAGVGGGILAGGLRGLVEAGRAWKARGLGMTLDELDAMSVLDRAVEDVATAPTQNIEKHLDALEGVYGAVSRMEGFQVGGRFSILRSPIPEGADFAALESARLASREAELTSRIKDIPISTARDLELAARIEVIERELANPELSEAAQEGLLERRSAVLKGKSQRDIVKARRAADERRSLEAERDNIRRELEILNEERAFTPGYISRGEAIKSVARKELSRLETRDPVASDEASIGEAMKIAAESDPAIASDGLALRKASKLLEDAKERKRVAEEIANACLAAGRSSE